MKTTLLASLLLVAGFSSVVSAHDYKGTLGKATTATDKWYFQCLNPNTVKVTFQVAKTAGATSAGCVKATYGTTPSATACSATFAPTVALSVATGAGAKFFTVNKVSPPTPLVAGGVSYTVRAHCIDSAGVHNPADQTDVQTYTQNQ